ncbi:hypothetical protein H6P81_009867 [Aristolochia fimbriata]|uniref:Aminotransferase-like plant mobile domain-containing protein n=1 Tax=Aristolochia fimbriata TaxID=158543 RepID=A0AAV7EM52_ARIFI|nr:hypothetical protein H6P81_009867 [Aristolochia fimbriata]
MPRKKDEVHLAAFLLVWLSQFVFHSTGATICNPTVFKVASYMATGIRFALDDPALACLYRGLGQATAGLSSIAQWSYLYSWLAVYFYTHGEDLEGVRCPGMISFGNPSLQRTFDEEQVRDLFRRLPVSVWNRYILGGNTISSLVVESKALISRPAYESLLSVLCLCGNLGIARICSWIWGLRPVSGRLVTLWEAKLVRPCGQLDLPLRGEPTRDPRTTFVYYTWWKEHMFPQFEQGRLESTASVAAGSSGQEEDYDSDHSHPCRRRPEGKKQIVAPSANKKRAPLTSLNGAFASKKKELVEAQPASLPSPPTFLPPILETEPPPTSCPPMEPPEPEPPVDVFFELLM